MQGKPKKVVIIGPESTGKSTLSHALAQHYKEPWVEEFARGYIESLNREYQYADLLEIAQGQMKMEDAKAQEAKDLLFCDTDLHVIQVWSEHKYRKTASWVLEEIKKRAYDLYLLTDIDIPWEADPQREHPEPDMRQFFYDWYERLLSGTGVPVAKISGNLQQRLAKSIAAIEENFLKVR
ncbi:ATP-binding protein [Echinicola marina]|uniref:AAA family ATPase n=1 Tax=Echinicola marina TaxID=2859768 RepID=UPI001CF649DC|nr:ATP-binding protein [Echinicola marina]UCS94455.1 ATP-binding protein [Echinicola marina]